MASSSCDDLLLRVDRRLAHVIKTTHADLRRRAIERRADEDVWTEHVSYLQQSGHGHVYAAAMAELSDKHWISSNLPQQQQPLESRTSVSWLVQKLDVYFRNGDRERFRKRLQRRASASTAAHGDHDDGEHGAGKDNLFRKSPCWMWARAITRWQTWRPPGSTSRPSTCARRPARATPSSGETFCKSPFGNVWPSTGWI